jgi:hypothetical protein
MDIVGDLDRMARSFARHLRAESKSPQTVETGGEAVTRLMTMPAGYARSSVRGLSSRSSGPQPPGFPAVSHPCGR